MAANGKVWTQFGRFAGAGAIGTGGHYAILIFLVQTLHADSVMASMAGSIVGAAINYALNYHLTFRSQRPHGEAAPRFFIVAVLGFGLNATIMWGAVRVLSLHYFVAQVIATGLVLVVIFAINRSWTFGK